MYNQETKEANKIMNHFPGYKVKFYPSDSTQIFMQIDILFKKVCTRDTFNNPIVF